MPLDQEHRLEENFLAAKMLYEEMHGKLPTVTNTTESLPNKTVQRMEASRSAQETHRRPSADSSRR
jgi:hypothetical protein